MFEYIFGSISKERVLFFLTKRNEGYAREIAKFYQTDLTPIQNQLNKLETGGIIISQNIGKTKLYKFNPRYPFIKELITLIEKAVLFLPEEERNKLEVYRKRPRRAGKPL
jgi:predicted transcriptional regulator